MTAIIQSSSASVGILQSFTVTGAITLVNAVPIILGQNIGTCVTALISSTGANRNAKRAAMVHLYFNLLGTLILFIPYLLLPRLSVGDFWGASVTAVDVALIHTGFNLFSTLILFPLSGLLERLAVLTVK